jgi:hypothetical protein
MHVIQILDGPSQQTQQRLNQRGFRVLLIDTRVSVPRDLPPQLPKSFAEDTYGQRFERTRQSRTQQHAGTHRFTTIFLLRHNPAVIVLKRPTHPRDRKRHITQVWRSLVLGRLLAPNGVPAMYLRCLG